MHEQNILKIQDEAIKVISEVQKLLENSDEQKAQHFQTLDNEKKKLENLEFVISIVGTVKAGKSTTINAIVGQEILPNRSAPMTTLPTLVTHKAGQKEPTLTMSKHEILNKFLEEVRQSLTNSDKTKDAVFLKDSQGKETAEALKKPDFKFRNYYQNREEIFEFLKTLNDLMRLAKDLGLKPPYAEFEEIDELPRIEVEFYYLKNMENIHNAKLSLLDTPGPDEFGHSKELQNIFKTQLKQSSAIMLVMNYTVINNEGAGKTREEIKEIQKLMEQDHLFVLVNKFDDRTSKDPDYEQTKLNISKSMFDETIKTDNIFPISSKWAYFSNLGKREIEINGKIDKNLSWREDFGKGVLGDLWEEDIEDTERVKKICNKKYENSYFEEPLNKIIIHGYSNATFKSLSSVLHKTKEINAILSNVFKVRETSLEKDVERLNGDISNLEKDIKSILAIKKSLEDEIKEELANIEKTIDEQEKKFLQKAKTEIGTIYDDKEDTAKSEEEEEDSTKDDSKRTFGLPPFLSGMGRSNKSDKKEFKEYGELTFEDKDEAKDFINELSQALDTNVKNTLSEFDEMLKNQVGKFIPRLNKKVEDHLGVVIDKIKERIGSDIEIKIPTLKIDKNGKIVGNHLDNAIKTENETRTILVKQDSWWGGFKRAISPESWEWGRDEEEEEYQSFKITKKDVDKNIDLAFEDISNFIKKTTDDIFELQIKHEINQSIEKLTKEIENYRSEMMDVVKKAQADTFDKKEEIVSAKKYQEISARLNNRIEACNAYLEKINAK